MSAAIIAAMSIKALLTVEDVNAIAGGYHPDPFRVLGPHQVQAEPGLAPEWEVRAFAPEAESLQICSHGKKIAMEKRHPAGVFCGALDHAPGNYRLIASYADGRVSQYDDPYRFPPLLSGFELHLHAEGTLYEGWRTLGAHLAEVDGVGGVRFAVWAPEAYLVSVAGDFNGWNVRAHPMRLREGGVWELFLPGLAEGALYKYFIQSKMHGAKMLKSDPYAFYCERPPQTASVVKALDSFEWTDSEWMAQRAETDWDAKPVSCYEVHLESWTRHRDGQPLSYRQLAERLVPYVKQMGFTHIELMPILEHPYSGSWGYQVTGFFAPTSRFGTPDDFAYFVNECHRAGIGVILDWVPAHYPKDAHGLAYFDGSALYEHADSRKGEHRDWGTLIFNYGRNEVRSFLISSALYWVKQFHLDGLRVDAVASMLYLNYSRKEGEWVPNIYGGQENLEAIDFLRKFNDAVRAEPGVVTIAEESTSFGGVTQPTYLNGLGFSMKWNMGWMHDMLGYFGKDPIHRGFHQNSITFSLLYAFTEHFLLPISHDEVVHGKGSLIGRMPGDEWRKFANARAFFGYMFTHPGKKLLFMGCEVGQYEEWDYEGQIRWELLEYRYHRGLQACVRDLNCLYQAEPALHEVESHWEGFEWIDFHDWKNSVISFVRRAKDPEDFVVVVCNFTPLTRPGYRIGVPRAGAYQEVFNSDSTYYGGSDAGNAGEVWTVAEPLHERANSVELTLPPLGVILLKPSKV
jgi:1,4-alpha-glucan branching enzyme